MGNEENIFTLMLYVHRKLSKPFEGYFHGEFTSLQLNALCLLCACGPVTVSELARGLHVPRQQISRLVEKLYEDGRVVRRLDSADRRRVLISVSDETARHIGAGRERFLRSLRTDLGKIDVRDYREFQAAVEIINRVLTQIPQNEMTD